MYKRQALPASNLVSNFPNNFSDWVRQIKVLHTAKIDLQLQDIHVENIHYIIQSAELFFSLSNTTTAADLAKHLQIDISAKGLATYLNKKFKQLDTFYKTLCAPPPTHPLSPPQIFIKLEPLELPETTQTIPKDSPKNKQRDALINLISELLFEKYINKTLVATLEDAPAPHHQKFEQLFQELPNQLRYHCTQEIKQKVFERYIVQLEAHLKQVKSE